MPSTQQRYKQDYDWQIHVAAPTKPTDCVSFYPPLFATTSKMNAARAALCSYIKLVFRSLGSFYVITVCAHPLIVGQRGVKNVVFTDRVTRALRSKRSYIVCNLNMRQRKKNISKSVNNKRRAGQIPLKLKGRDREIARRSKKSTKLLSMSERTTIFGT